jgi:predicted anti-sigma-YlaC factor YlaD
MNEHEIIRKQLMLAAAGSVDPKEFRGVQKHVQVCETCRADLDTWSLYAQALRQLPQPAMPHDLIQRTQARIASEQAMAARRANAWFLGALALFGWVASFASWILIDAIIGPTLIWPMASTLLAWITAGSAAAILSRRRHLGRVL